MRTKSEWSQVKRRKESEYGKEVYADPAHDSYPLTVGGKPSRKETMAAWRYLHVAENRAKYSDEAYRHVASRIRSFAKKHFDEELQSPDEANKSLRIVFPIAR